MHLLNKHHQSKWQNGFTLIELMVTVAIVAILIAVAAPSFTESIKRSKIKNSYDQLSSLIMFAKTEAVTRGTNITISGINNGVINVKDAANKVLRQADISDGLIAFAIVPANTSQITFLPSGQISGGNAITITVCDADNDFNKRQTVVSIVGRISNQLTTTKCDL